MSGITVCFCQLFSKRLLKRFKLRSPKKNYIYIYIYKLYFAMTAANNKTHTVKGKEKKSKKKHTTYNSEQSIKRKA